MTGIKPNLMDFKFPNEALKNFLEKNYGFVIPIIQNIGLMNYMNHFNDGYDKMFNSEDNYKNKFQPYFNNYNQNNYNQNNYNQNGLYEMSNKRYDNIENNYIKGFNIENYNINNKINNERPKKTLIKSNSDFNNNISYPNDLVKNDYNNFLNKENAYIGNNIIKSRPINISSINIVSYNDIKEQ